MKNPSKYNFLEIQSQNFSFLQIFAAVFPRKNIFISLPTRSMESKSTAPKKAINQNSLKTSFKSIKKGI